MKNLTGLSRKIGTTLRKKELTLAVAESCTGGLLSSVITDVAGSSDYFLGGVAAYSNAQKRKLLKISPLILRRYSAVSKEVTIRMAKNIRRVAKSDIGIGITGYAGPNGGTKKNPRGTVYVAVACKARASVKRFRFKGNRTRVKRQSVEKALTLLNRAVPAD